MSKKSQINGNHTQAGKDNDRAYDTRKSTKAKRGRGARNSSKRSADAESRNDRLYSGGTNNDPSWWNKTGQLAKDSGNISFNHATGSRLTSFEWGKEYYSTPGIMRIDYVPNFGRVVSSEDALNVAARHLYDIINAKNSRNPSYDPSDIMTYVIAVANAWALHAWLMRAIGLMLTYSVTNRYVPDALLKSMGIAPISAQNDITTWRNVANRLALKLNMLAVPNGIDYFKRMRFMNLGLYQDDPTDKASFMYFQPKAFLWLREPDDAHATAYLSYEKFETSDDEGFTPEWMDEYIRGMTRPLFNSTDIATMSSDIIKAYGLENCYSNPAISETYMTIPEFNPGVLIQINNAMVCPVFSTFYDHYQITQDMNYNILTSSFDLAESAAGATLGVLKQKPHVVNLPISNPSPDDMLEATRLMYSFSTSKNALELVGTEIIVDTVVFKFAEISSDEWEITEQSIPALLIAANDSRLVNVVPKIADYSKFHSAPLLHCVIITAMSSPQEIVNHTVVSDLQNYTSLSDVDLKKLHEAALLSVFMPTGN